MQVHTHNHAGDLSSNQKKEKKERKSDRGENSVNFAEETVTKLCRIIRIIDRRCIAVKHNTSHKLSLLTIPIVGMYVQTVCLV